MNHDLERIVGLLNCIWIWSESIDGILFVLVEKERTTFSTTVALLAFTSDAIYEKQTTVSSRVLAAIGVGETYERMRKNIQQQIKENGDGNNGD